VVTYFWTQCICLIVTVDLSGTVFEMWTLAKNKHAARNGTFPIDREHGDFHLASRATRWLFIAHAQRSHRGAFSPDYKS